MDDVTDGYAVREIEMDNLTAKQREFARGVRAAMKAATRKVHFKSDSSINATAEMAGMDLAAAYVCGAEETQAEIISRINALIPVTTERPS